MNNRQEKGQQQTDDNKNQEIPKPNNNKQLDAQTFSTFFFLCKV